MSVGVISMFVPAETPVILFIEAPKPAPSASSQTVGVMSSKRCIPVPDTPWSTRTSPMPGRVIVIAVFEYPPPSPSAIDRATFHPLSSSPEPEKPKAEAIPIGLPVTVASCCSHVNVAPPVTVSSPALAAEIPARDPHSAETPTFPNLFIIISFVVFINMNGGKLTL